MVKNEPHEFEIGGQKVQAVGFIADTKTYYITTDNHNEAYYLVSFFNSPLLNELIKPMQTRGQFGPRDIHKKVLEFPIPKFDPSDLRHIRLVELGEECSKKVDNWLQSGGPSRIKSIGKLRTMVRKMLDKELKEIDTIVQKILSI